MASHIVYRTFWKKRSNPDDCGDGDPIDNPKDAHALCAEANRLWPHIKHWYEKGNVTFEEQE